MRKLVSLCFLLEILLSSHNVSCSNLEVPITISLVNRQWDLPESTLVGTVISSLTASKLFPESEFGIEGINGTEKFFTVDRKSGRVSLKSPLNYATHPTFLIYVTLRSGINQPIHKVEIFVRVLPSISSITTPSTISSHLFLNDSEIIDPFITTSGIFSSVEGSLIYPSESIIPSDHDYTESEITFVNTVPNENTFTPELSTAGSYPDLSTAGIYPESTQGSPTDKKDINNIYFSNTSLIAIIVTSVLVTV